MKKEFVPYALAVKLKALGFDEPCFAKYTFIPEDEIDWFTIPEQGITNKTSFGSSKNYNSKSFEKEGTISAPTFSQAFRWFREKNFYVSINTYHSVSLNKPFGLSIDYLHESGKWDYFDYRGESDFETYEEAELACLTKLIEIVETRTK